MISVYFKDNIVESEMNVDMKHHQHFVATRGKILRNIADEFGGVTISFPRSGVKSEKVVIKGSKDCVEAAKKKIANIVDDLVSCVMQTCLELRRYGYRIGSKMKKTWLRNLIELTLGLMLGLLLYIFG